MKMNRLHRLWWSATALMLLPIVWGLIANLVAAGSEQRPVTPYDGVNAVLAEQWRFAAEAAPFVTPGSQFTVRCEPACDEMSLFMMAAGLIPHATALPSSYYGRPLPSTGAEAPYVLLFGSACRRPVGMVPVAQLEAGCVYRRCVGRATCPKQSRLSQVSPLS